MWSSNIKVLLEQSHTDCFLTSFKNFFFIFLLSHFKLSYLMSCKTPYGSEGPKYLLSSPFQRELCWFLSKQSPALNNTTPLLGSRMQGLFTVALLKTTVQHSVRKATKGNKTDVLRVCLLELMGALGSFFTLGRSSGQALGWIPLTKRPPHCSLQSPPDGEASCTQNTNLWSPKAKGVRVPWLGRRTSEVNVVPLRHMFLATLLFLQTTVLLALRALRKHNKPRDFIQVFWVSSYLQTRLRLSACALLPLCRGSESPDLPSFLFPPFHLGLSRQGPSLPQEVSGVGRKLCHVAIWFFASMIFLFKGNHVKWTSREV